MCQTHKCGGEAKDAQQGTRRGEGHVLVVARLLAELHVGTCDVVGQRLRDHRVLLLAQCDVAPHQLHVKRVMGHGRLNVMLVHVGDVLSQSVGREWRMVKI